MFIVHILLGLIAVMGAFGFIIFIHELGHFIVARAVGIRCPQFAIGFGPAIFSYRWRGTLFGLRLFPVGGYVLMVGEDPNADQSDSWHDKVGAFLPTVTYPTTPSAILANFPASVPGGEMVPEGEIYVPTEADRQEVLEHLQSLKPDQVYARQEALEGNFNHKSFLQRICVIMGGVTMNFIAATLLLWGLGFTVGLGQVEQFSRAEASEVTAGSAGSAAGLLPGDVVLEVGGQSVLSGSSMIKALAPHPAEPLDILVSRGNQKLNLKVVPDIYLDDVFFSGTEGRPKVAYMPDGYAKNYQTLGVAVGDVITAVGDQPVKTSRDFLDAVKAALPKASKSGQEAKIKLVLQRENKGPITLEGTPNELKPEGKMGVGLTSVLSLGFQHATTTRVIEVLPGTLAAQMGFRSDDELASVDGAAISDRETADEALAKLSSSWTAGHSVTLVVGRDRKLINLDLTTAPPPTLTELGLKLEPISASMILLRPADLIVRMIFAPISVIQDIVAGSISGKKVAQQSAGPLGMMQMIYEISAHGVAIILFFLAILNAAVGAFNVIPFPALDGSRCLILILAWIRRKDFDATREAQLHFAGLLVLLGLVLLITLQDIHRLWVGTPLMK